VRALEHKEVDGVLIDAYSASTFRKTIEIANLQPVKLVEHPRYYGVVLSGPLKNIANEMKDNLKLIENEFTELIASNTDGMMVSKLVLIKRDSNIKIKISI